MSKPNVLLVSIDALKPEFILEQAAHGVTLPTISALMEQALVAEKGMQSVFPTFTYPSHQSMITGVNPNVHGIVNNGIFDPKKEHNGAWHWFVNQNVITLWEAAKNAGYVVGSVAFPTSIGAKGDYILPEFWWDGSDIDHKFIDAVSVPQGLAAELVAATSVCPNGLDLTDEGDAQRFTAAHWVLDTKIRPAVADGKSFFMTAYFASFDESAHIHGVSSKEAANSLMKIDTMLGKLIATAKDIAGDNLVVCVCSDHGSLDNQFNISPNVVFTEKGLISVDDAGNMTDWKAFCQRAGGVGEIRMHADATEADRQLVLDILNELQADPAKGILEVLTNDMAQARGGFPESDFVVISRKGFEIREDLTGPYCHTHLSQAAQHGYSEQFEEMRASFILSVPGVAPKHIGMVKLIDVAPTLAGVMGIELPKAQGKSVLA